MHSVRVTVVVPTLAASPRLLECLASLEAQTLPGVQIVVVDNSGTGAIHRLGAARYRFRLIENRSNAGFGGAVNQGWRLVPAEYCAVLNDDAIADPRWLETQVAALERRPDAGMAASCIVTPEGAHLDSAGMLIARDGSSKQRGHGQPPASYGAEEDVLLPSGCAALYRHAMLEQTGLFEEDFFSVLRGHRPGPPRPLGRLELCLRARRARGPRLLTIVRRRVGNQGVVRGAQPSAPLCAMPAPLLARRLVPLRQDTLRLACGRHVLRPGQGRRVPPGRRQRLAPAVAGTESPRGSDSQSAPPAAPARGHYPHSQDRPR
ncbi:MAG: glycosyltransferase [Bryobacterales bacterium]|nr:glycosyltransferase [Bryobacterales bacterium]